MKLSEAHHVILQRLIEAMDTDHALPVRVGPRMFGSALPEALESVNDRFAREREDQTETGGKRTLEDKKAERRRLERRRKCSPQRITRMEEAFRWVRDAVADEKHRKCLLAYAMCKARHWSWSDYVTARNRRKRDLEVWVRQKTYEWNLKSLQAIEKEFLHNSSLCIDLTDLQAGQIRAKTAGKSISSDSGLRSWMAPDGKPDQYRTNIQAPRPVSPPDV
jgi:hypothetical protein